jgi:hypothetical protein
MSDGQTNPGTEVTKPQLDMFDVMFGSEENTNPEVTSLEEVSDSNVEYEPDSGAVEYATDDGGDYEEIAESEDTEDYEVAEEELVAETPLSHTVKVDGEEYEVTLDELRNGYQRQADYTRKAQSLAEQRKAYEANLEAVSKERQQYSQVLENMGQYQNMELSRFQNVNWQELKDSDPMEYMEKRIEFQDAKDQIVQIKNEQQRVHQQTNVEYAERLTNVVKDEAEKLSQILPQYAGPDSSLRDELRGYALGQGFSEQDIDGITDHRVVLVLHKAMMQDKALQGSSQKVRKTVPKVVKAGAPESKKQRSTKAMQLKRERLKKSGNRQDATDVFLDLI